MAVKTFVANEVLTASDTNTYLNNGGLVYVTSGTFTSVTSVSVNNCFTTTMDNYRLIVTEITRSTTGAMTLRFRAGGADNTASNYNYAQLGLTSGGGGANNNANNDNLWNCGNYSDVASSYLETFAADIYSPFISGRTYAMAQSMGFAGGTYYRTQGMTQYGTNSFDGFSLITTAGTFSGKYYLYGYRKA